MRTQPTPRTLLLHALSLAVFASISACGHQSPAGPGEAGPPVQSLAIVGTLTLSQPGDTGRLAAIATLTDGATRDVSGEAIWQCPGSRPVTIVSKDGLVTAIAFGLGDISVTYGSVSRSSPVRVAPDGAFLLTGAVTATGAPINQARVDLMDTPDARSTFTNGSGVFVLPLTGAGRLRISKFGFEPVERTLAIDRDVQVAIDMPARPATDLFLGHYQLAFVASPSCTLPAAAMRREYRVLVEPAAPRAGGADLHVALNGAGFVFDQWFGKAGFTGMVDRDLVTFEISGDPQSAFTFAEVFDGLTMSYSGTAAGTIGSAGMTAPFAGDVVLVSGPAVLARCSAADHRLEFRR